MINTGLINTGLINAGSFNTGLINAGLLALFIWKIGPPQEYAGTSRITHKDDSKRIVIKDYPFFTGISFHESDYVLEVNSREWTIFGNKTP